MIYKIEAGVGGKVQKSYGACPNFYLVVRELPTLNRLTGPVRDTDEAVFVLTPPESYWFKVWVTTTARKSNSN